MNICEATKLASAQNKCIARSEFSDFIRIQPTDTESCCIISCADGTNMCPQWQPQLEDLIADDWGVFMRKEKQDELV